MKTSDRVEKMTEAALDAELRKFGIDPDALLSSTFNKVCAKLKDKSAALARAEEQNRKLEKALRCVLPSLESIGPNSVVEQARSALEGK